MEERLSKSSVKLMLGTLKIIPMLLAICEATNCLFYILDIEIPAVSFIGGTSFIPLLFIYLASWVFKFCICHRLFLYYTAILNLINVTDFTLMLPVDVKLMTAIYSTITAAFLFLILYFHRRQRYVTVTKTTVA